MDMIVFPITFSINTDFVLINIIVCYIFLANALDSCKRQLLRKDSLSCFD